MFVNATFNELTGCAGCAKVLEVELLNETNHGTSSFSGFGVNVVAPPLDKYDILGIKTLIIKNLILFSIKP